VRPRILLVDDEDTVREVVSDYFRRKGFEVLLAPSGSKAMAIADQTPINIVVMDIDLAGESGMELLKFFKSNFPKLPVIMFTGLPANDDLVEQAWFRGANGFMRKSSSLDDLYAAVKSYVEGH